MLSGIRSRLDLKLGLALAFTLCAVMSSLAGIFMYQLSTVIEEENKVTELLRSQNDDLRKELFALQAKLVDIPQRLRTDPMPVILDWAKNEQGASETVYSGRQEITARFKKRGERRDLQKQNRFVVSDGPNGPGFAYGVFENGSYADKVVEVTLATTPLAAIEDKIAAVLNETTSEGSLASKVQDLSNTLIDDAIAAEKSRIAIVDAVDHLAKVEAGVDAAVNSTVTNVIVTAIAGIIAANLLVWLVTRQMITQALIKLSQTIGAIGRRQQVDVAFSDRTDEIGDLAKGVVGFKLALSEIMDLRSKQQAEREKSETALKSRLSDLADQLEKGMGGRVQVVNQSTDELVQIGETLNQLAEETRAKSNDSSDLAAKSAEYTEDVMARTARLRQSTQTISEEAMAQQDLTQEVAREAEDVAVTVSKLEEMAGKIGGVVELIENIAGQTNLLALNATIEASRAGDAGAGFAVVAGEVKKLASETSQATQTISDQIAGIQHSIATVSGAVTTIRQRVRTVSEGVDTVTSGVRSLTAETAEISTRIEEVSNNAKKVAGVNSTVEAAANQTGERGAEVSTLTGRISSAVIEMREELRAILAREKQGVPNAAR